MNKSHILVGLSCSSLFSLLSQAAASPSSLQTSESSAAAAPAVFFSSLSSSKWFEFESGGSYIQKVQTQAQANQWKCFTYYFCVHIFVSLCITVLKATLKSHSNTWFNLGHWKVNTKTPEWEISGKKKKTNKKMNKWDKERKVLSFCVSIITN